MSIKSGNTRAAEFVDALRKGPPLTEEVTLQVGKTGIGVTEHEDLGREPQLRLLLQRRSRDQLALVECDQEQVHRRRTFIRRLMKSIESPTIVEKESNKCLH